jgi:hypothetical protein
MALEQEINFMSVQLLKEVEFLKELAKSLNRTSLRLCRLDSVTSVSNNAVL